MYKKKRKKQKNKNQTKTAKRKERKTAKTKQRRKKVKIKIKQKLKEKKRKKKESGQCFFAVLCIQHQMNEVAGQAGKQVLALLKPQADVLAVFFLLNFVLDFFSTLST